MLVKKEQIQFSQQKKIVQAERVQCSTNCKTIVNEHVALILMMQVGKVGKPKNDERNFFVWKDNIEAFMNDVKKEQHVQLGKKF